MVCKAETHSDETKAGRYTFNVFQALHRHSVHGNQMRANPRETLRQRMHGEGGRSSALAVLLYIFIVILLPLC